MVNFLERILDRLERIFMTMAAAAVFAMMISISVDAVGRYLFNSPLQGSYEITSLYLMVILGFMGAARTYTLGGHIKLDILLPTLRRMAGDAVDRFTALPAALAFALLATFAGIEAIERFRNLDTTFGVIQFPVYWSYVWVPLGSGLLTLRLLAVVFLGPPKRDS